MSTPEAGRELDALIAEKVMGWAFWEQEDTSFNLWDRGAGEVTGLPAFSTNMPDAWSVVEKLQASGYDVIVCVNAANRDFSCEIAKPEWAGSEVWSAATAPLAICRAALAVVGAA